MDNKNNNHNGNNSGFLAGVLVGVVITLLFTTKKGREIFKETVDRAIDKFNNLQEKVEEKIDEEIEDEEVDGSDYVKPEPSPKEEKKEVRYLASDAKDEEAVETDTAHVAELEEKVVQEEENIEPPVKKKSTHVKYTAEHFLANEEQEGQAELKPEAPKKSSPVRKFFKLKKS